MREPENQASNHAQDSIAVSQPDQWYRAILDSSADGILVTDMRGRVREGNQALSRMIGLSLEEIIGRRTADIFPPAAGKEIARHLQKLRRVRQGRIEVAAFHLVQPDGHTIDIEINFALLKEGEEPTAIVGVVRDVTARKQQEAELRLLQRINNALISAPDLDEVLQTIAEGMVDTFRYAGSMIFLSDEEYNHLVLRAVVHNSETVAQAEKLLGYPLLGHKFTPEKDEIYHRLYHDRQPILSTDIADHLARLTSHKTRKPAARAIARLIRARVKSIMLVPLVVNDVVRGTLVLAARRHLHEEDATRVQAFATQASIAIEKAQLLEIERRRASHTESLAAVAQQITADLHLTDTLSRVTDSALAVLDADRVAIFLMGRKTGSVYCAHSIGLSKEYVETINRRYREVPGGRVLSTRQAVQVVDILNDPRITAVRQTMIEEGFRTYTALPMLVHGEIIGSLVFYRDTVHPFSSEELALGQSFAQQAAAAIENARLFSETERRLQEISTLYEASQACLSVSDQGSLLSKIVAAAARASGATMGSVMLRDEQQGEYVYGAIYGMSEETATAIETQLRIPLGQGLAGQIDSSGRPMIVADAATDPHWIPFAMTEVQRSVLGVPLVGTASQPLGVITLSHTEVGRFDENHARLLSTFANQAAIAIENARLFEAEHTARQVAETLRETANIVGSTLKLDQVLNLIIEQLQKVVAYDSAAIFLLQEDQLKVVAGRGFPKSEQVMQLSLPVEEDFLLHHIINSREPLVIDDAQLDSRFRGLAGTDYVRSWIGIPLVSKEQVIGCLTIDSRQIGIYNEDNAQLAQAFAHQASIAIENARLFEQVLDSEERFRDVMGNTGDWIWEVDAEGRYTYSSPVVARILGYTVEEVLGKHYHDFFHPDDRETLRATVKEASQERTPVIDLVSRSIHQDGHTVILETTGVPMFGPDGQLLGYRGTSRDVTARVQAEEALTASERKYRTVVEHANDWIWTLDCEGNFTFFNQAAEKASGYQLKDWIGRSFAPIILPEYLPHVQQVFAGTLAGSLQSYEVRLLSQDDRILTLAVNTAPLYEGEKIVGTVSMGRDVTAQRQLEDQLRQAQKMEAIGTLAGGVAHDFNNILGGILGYASFIESQLPVGDPLRPDVETIIRSARRASDLTAQLLAFARGGRYEIRPVNLNNTVNEVVQLLSRTIDKAISIETHLADDLTAVEGDAAQLQQMLLNLCLNARDAMPAGGKLIIETSSISLDEEYTSTQLEIEAGDYVFLMVSDTGMGIDAETQAHIFEPFFTTKQELPGEKHSGLGLAMVYGIVRGHGGTIHVYSELGKGTTFKIYLPAAERPAVEKKAEKSALVGGEETILVVDDEETILAMVNRLLSNAGYTVVLAESGVEAVELYRERGHEIDLVILDMIMPEMGGRETYERLREIDPGVRVLLSSGYSQNGQAQEIINAGVQGFLQKPFDLSRILNKVRKALHE